MTVCRLRRFIHEKLGPSAATDLIETASGRYRLLLPLTAIALHSTFDIELVGCLLGEKDFDTLRASCRPLTAAEERHYAQLLGVPVEP